ncbi:ABC transporter ATP-binding protein [Marinobacter sp. TBZ242]|uniref:ABC transporter ATP-binding protein n=1 Tax=Marinobacter azerbaijanicus TaxID=3050455 RepID=A0ABT7IGG0_9GAMM|nr:ABC transporter ATP-binding protein [Marinobacter sp. TBZ242]MDL0433261.1 ABC transporter ATP-binding protein [Marinobacter sp. TBZ242]
MTATLEVRNVSKTFESDNGDRIQALAPANLGVKQGEFLSIIGPSGCGKSTLFNIIGGMIPPDSGEVIVNGVSVSGPHKDIGMVFQEESTFPWRTVLDNVAFSLEVAGMEKKERLEKARHFVELVGLTGFEHHFPHQLSGGMRQRTAIARTLASEPRILLMDEPFGALDEQTRLLLGDKLLKICDALKQTTMLITHNITEAVQLSDRVAVMSYRPGTIMRTIDIELPRPRDSELISTDKFAAYVGQIWEDLRTEADRGMKAVGEA